METITFYSDQFINSQRRFAAILCFRKRMIKVHLIVHPQLGLTWYFHPQESGARSEKAKFTLVRVRKISQGSNLSRVS
jgi:hypothetical protein